MKNRSKRYKEILKSATKDKKTNIKEVIELVKKNATSKFDESIDVSLKINLKQSKGGDLSLRSVTTLPNGSGKNSSGLTIPNHTQELELSRSNSDKNSLRSHF